MKLLVKTNVIQKCLTTALWTIKSEEQCLNATFLTKLENTDELEVLTTKSMFLDNENHNLLLIIACRIENLAQDILNIDNF